MVLTNLTLLIFIFKGYLSTPQCLLLQHNCLFYLRNALMKPSLYIYLHHHNITILPFELFLRDDDLHRGYIFSIRDRVIKDADASDNFLNKFYSILKTRFNNVCRVTDQDRTISSAFAVFYTCDFAVLK